MRAMIERGREKEKVDNRYREKTQCKQAADKCPTILAQEEKRARKKNEEARKYLEKMEKYKMKRQRANMRCQFVL